MQSGVAIGIVAGAFALVSGCSDDAGTKGSGPGQGGSGGTASSSATQTVGSGGTGGAGGAASVGSSGGSAGAAGSSAGSGGSGGSSGGSADAGVDAGTNGDAGDASVASDGTAPATDGAAGRDAPAESGASKCSPACSAATPVCVEATGMCKAIEVLALYTVYEQNMDLAHRSWVREANGYFPTVAQANGFTYQAITGWETLRTVTPAPGRVVLFLDNKPTDATLQAAFKTYMDNGGAWMGFHFAAYNAAPTDWDWYFNTFLASGGYNGNTWRPTSAKLKVEDTAHPVVQGLGALFTAAPNEWYRWKVDLRTISNIKILLSVDPSSFPLGTGPKPEEIWHDGYYPVVWTNTNYKMLYVNMGHNDMDYEGGTNRQLSFAFMNMLQDGMLLNAIKWLGGVRKAP
jgi:hypothetical protein